MGERELGPLLGRGRTADVFALDEHRVLRRYRPGQGSALRREAAVMAHVAAHGYPVPEVHDVDGTDLVMQRLDGPTMFGAIAADPSQLEPMADLLADLHLRLHAIPPPAGLEPAAGPPGTALVHLDLHPENVIMTTDGPFVIDWPNAAVGDPDVDPAYVWAVLAVAELPAGDLDPELLAVGRAVLIERFLGPFDRPRVAAAMLALIDDGFIGRRNLDRPGEAGRLAELLASLRT